MNHIYQMDFNRSRDAKWEEAEAPNLLQLLRLRKWLTWTSEFRVFSEDILYSLTHLFASAI